MTIPQRDDESRRRPKRPPGSAGPRNGPAGSGSGSGSGRLIRVASAPTVLPIPRDGLLQPAHIRTSRNSAEGTSKTTVRSPWADSCSKIRKLLGAVRAVSNEVVTCRRSGCFGGGQPANVPFHVITTIYRGGRPGRAGSVAQQRHGEEAPHAWARRVLANNWGGHPVSRAVRPGPAPHRTQQLRFITSA